MGTRRKIVIASLTMAVAASLAGRPMVAEAATVNTDPTQLVVYNNNIENMVTCRATREADYMKAEPAPTTSRSQIRTRPSSTADS